MSKSREHILNTSFCLFLQKSFKEVTMSEIVERTGLSKGAFYHYFKSKEELFKEVINTFFFEKMVIDYNKLGSESLWAFYHDYAKEIKKIINELKKYWNYKDAKVNINYFMMMFDALKMFPGFQTKLRKTQKNEVESWKAVIKLSRRKGEFSSAMSDEQIARMFIYSNDGIGLYVLLNGKYDSADYEMIKLWDNFYKELKD